MVDNFTLPVVEGKDIAWVCEALKLPSTAFCGVDGKDPRLEILKNNGTFDVEACPGSGKTTLLVAKLAILARKWTSHRRGLCVLSHTNAARKEIENKLGNTVAGKKLLSYPHFIGTIHSFVNEYLAIPWLRSKGIDIKLIDDDKVLSLRGRMLAYNEHLKRQKNYPNFLRVCGTDFSVGSITWGKAILSESTDTYKSMVSVCKQTTEAGFFCYDEMFIWGRELVERFPQIVEVLRERFPIMFIDEVQDNNALQTVFLYRLFIAGDKPVTRQRFGDSNQEIYDHAGDTPQGQIDPFPNMTILRTVPNSLRFGQKIATFANLLAVNNLSIQGLGPVATYNKPKEKEHAILLFNKETVTDVIPYFGRYLTKQFTAEEILAGSFHAVGAVHRRGDDKHCPHSVYSYWPGYNHELSRVNARPSSFLQYMLVGQQMAQEKKEAHYVVNNFLTAIMQAALQAPNDVQLPNAVKHRRAQEILCDNLDALSVYMRLVGDVVSGGYPRNKDDWRDNWVPKIQLVVNALCGARVPDDSGFLKWEEPSSLTESKPRNIGNVYTYPADGPVVSINVGSIHSVKGETHTATLVLDTFFKSYHFKMIKPWLLGKKTRCADNNLCARLRIHYVAMSRPSHLLCLAVNEETFNEKELERLKTLGWNLLTVESVK